MTLFNNSPTRLSFDCWYKAVANPTILKEGRQFISPVVIYRKCTQRTVCLLHRKRRLFEEKNYKPKRGGGASSALTPTSPFESATGTKFMFLCFLSSLFQLKCIHSFCRNVCILCDRIFTAQTSHPSSNVRECVYYLRERRVLWFLNPIDEFYVTLHVERLTAGGLDYSTQ